MRSSKSSFFLFAYILLLCVWYTAWLTLGDVTWWLVVMHRVVPYLFLPVPLFFVWELWQRRYKRLLLLMLPVSMFLSLYHPYVIPKAANVRDAELSVMTYNVLYSNLDYAGVADVIRHQDADLVALQEVQPDMMDALRQRLASEYPYSMMGTIHDYGTTAVFSKQPFRNANILDLGADRPAVIVQTEVNGRTVTLAAVHLMAYGLQWVAWPEIPGAILEKTRIQNKQVEILMDQLDQESGIVLVACDCNTKETSTSYRMLDASFDSAAYTVGWRWNAQNLPDVTPDTNLQHIDYVFYRGLLQPVRAHTVNDSGGSDHLAVVTRFVLDVPPFK